MVIVGFVEAPAPSLGTTIVSVSPAAPGATLAWVVSSNVAATLDNAVKWFA